MKDFTTKEYIEPVITYYKVFYTPVHNEIVKKNLHCDLLLENNRTRDYKAIRKNDCFFVYGRPVKELYDEVADYAGKASTFEGELDEWEYREQERIQQAIKMGLLKAFKGV